MSRHKYSSVSGHNFQYLFAQQSPSSSCQNVGITRQRSEECGHECKCRRPRCSLACYLNYVQKEGIILDHFLKSYLPKGMVVYKGCLKMPLGSTIEEHNKARAKFNRLNAKTGIYIYCHPDITNPDDMHYDYVAYAPKSVKWVRREIRSMWKKSGGVYSSSKQVDCLRDVRRLCEYTTKSRKADEGTWRYLPSKGWRLTWGTMKFFTVPKEDVWKGWIKAFFSLKSS